MFDKVDGFVRGYDGTKKDAIYDRIRYLIELGSGITYVFYHSYAKIKIDFDDDLSLEETFYLHLDHIEYAMILSKFSMKIKVTTIYNIFLEKCSY